MKSVQPPISASYALFAFMLPQQSYASTKQARSLERLYGVEWKAASVGEYIETCGVKSGWQGTSQFSFSSNTSIGLKLKEKMPSS